MSTEVAKSAQETPEAGQAPTEVKPVEANEVEAKDAKAPEAEAGSDQKEGSESKTQEEKPGLPEKYELKLPEGSQLPPANVEKIAEIAKKQGLSQTQAQALVEHESEAIASFVEGQKNQLAEQSQKWVEDVKADKELGGERFTQNVELAKRVLHKFADEKLIKTLDETGLGNQPELVRVFSRIGKAMSEDKLVIPGAQASQPKSIEDLFYPDMKKE